MGFDVRQRGGQPHGQKYHLYSHGTPRMVEVPHDILLLLLRLLLRWYVDWTPLGMGLTYCLGLSGNGRHALVGGVRVLLVQGLEHAHVEINRDNRSGSEVVVPGLSAWCDSKMI